MKTGELRYKVSVAVSFTKKEIAFLLKCTRNHYDWTCQDAGLRCEDGASENGFIAQLKMFPDHQQFWDFSKFDLAAKILEMHTRIELGRRLFDEMLIAMKTLEKRHKELV